MRELPLGFVLAPPCEHRLAEDVVEDLVPDGTALVDRAQDAALGQRRQHRYQLGFGDLAEVGEIGDFVGDLRPRWRDEVVEDPGGDILLLGREVGHGALEMLLDDVLRTAEPVDRLYAELRWSPKRAPPPRGAA